MAAMTARLKEELCSVHEPRRTAMLAEAATMVRWLGEIDPDGAPILEIPCDTPQVAARLEKLLVATAGSEPILHRSGGGYTEPDTVRLGEGRASVIRRLGLVTRSGRRVVGLPPQVVAGGKTEAGAVWRGALLAAGELGDPSKGSVLDVVAPCAEAALALAGCARRLGLSAKVKEKRGSTRVVVKDGQHIAILLAWIGAHRTRLEWDAERRRREEETTNRLVNFDDANQRRSVKAARAAAQRVKRALEILGESIPPQLLEAGTLRVTHQQESLEELGKLADPPLTKDAIAGRIRRLLSMADARAEELGIPTTRDSVAEDPE